MILGTIMHKEIIKFNNINWDELKSNDNDINAQNITDVIKGGITNTIPHKSVNVKAHDY